jgi:hypothetical protein
MWMGVKPGVGGKQLGGVVADRPGLADLQPTENAMLTQAGKVPIWRARIALEKAPEQKQVADSHTLIAQMTLRRADLPQGTAPSVASRERSGFEIWVDVTGSIRADSPTC